MAVQLIRKVRDRQPQGHVGIDRNNKLGAKVFDAWNAPTLMQQSAMLRKPTVNPSSIGLKPGKFGLGAHATTGSVRYDIGEYGEAAPHAFAVILSAFNWSSTCSIVRKDGAFIPAQTALNTLRGVPWDPVDGGVYYYASPSGTKHSTVIFNRVSASTVNLIENGKQYASKTGLTGYGSTANPLCFLGDESDAELFTSTYGLFFAAVAFTTPLNESEILDFTANPWQIYEPETIPLFFSTVTAHASNASAGSYSISGQPASATRVHGANAAAGSYAISGQPATSSTSKNGSADAGSYVVSGQATGVLRTYAGNAGAGAYSIGGSPATSSASISSNAASG